MTYEATFEPGDAPPLVRASLTCPSCLRLAAALRLVDAVAVPVAELTCARCGRLWQVELTLAQLLRLVLTDAARMRTDLGPQARRIRELAACSDEDLGA
jgi:hypothetical protein